MSRTDLVDADGVEARLTDPTVVLAEADEVISARDTGCPQGAVRVRQTAA